MLAVQGHLFSLIDDAAVSLQRWMVSKLHERHARVDVKQLLGGQHARTHHAI